MENDGIRNKRVFEEAVKSPKRVSNKEALTEL